MSCWPEKKSACTEFNSLSWDQRAHRLTDNSNSWQKFPKMLRVGNSTPVIRRAQSQHIPPKLLSDTLVSNFMLSWQRSRDVLNKPDHPWRVFSIVSVDKIKPWFIYGHVNSHYHTPTSRVYRARDKKSNKKSPVKYITPSVRMGSKKAFVVPSLPKSAKLLV